MNEAVLAELRGVLAEEGSEKSALGGSLPWPFRDLAEGLGEVKYCLLHGEDTLAEQVASDIDIAVGPGGLGVVAKVLERCATPIQCFRYEATGFFFVCRPRELEGERRPVCVDVITDYRHDGRIFLASHELLHNCRSWHGLWLAGPEAEFAYLLLKQVYKGVFAEHHRARLQRLLLTLGLTGRQILRARFGSESGTRLGEWIAHGDWDSVALGLAELRRACRREAFKRYPTNSLRYLAGEARRCVERWRRPTGLLVAVLGADGTGKTTLIDKLKADCSSEFRRAETFHWQPYLFWTPALRGRIDDPHGQEPRGLVLSVTKLAYYLADFTLGYALKLKPRMARSTLVLFDRYYHDLLVDPCRYRYRGLQRLIRLVCGLIPRPNLFLILDAPSAAVLARKRELPGDEVQELLAGYRRLAAQLPNAYVLDASRPPREVAACAREILDRLLRERYLERRNTLPFDNGREDAIRELAARLLGVAPRFEKRVGAGGRSFLRISLRWGRGYLIGCDSKASVARGLEIYSPHRWIARLAKRFMRVALRFRIGRRLWPRVELPVSASVNGSRTAEPSLFESLGEIVGRSDLAFAVSLGTAGPSRKPVVQVMTRSGEIIGYAKSGWNRETDRLVAREALFYERLRRRNAPFAFPRMLYAGRRGGHFVLVEAAWPGNVRSAPRDFGDGYLSALEVFARFNARPLQILRSGFWRSLCKRAAALQDRYARALLGQGLAAIQESFGGMVLPFHLAHGDFTSWNAVLVDERLSFFDWETANWSAPAGFDLCHFFVQKLNTVEHRSPWAIWKAFCDQHRGQPGYWLMQYLDRIALSFERPDALLLMYVLDQLAASAADPNGLANVQFLAALAHLLMDGCSVTARAIA